MIETSQLPMDSDGGSLRGIAVRINGDSRGGITRLLSPSSWGELLKPFVFLDYFELHADSMAGFQPHPHSGIATHTTFLDGGMSYGDSTGMSGTMSPGTIEWMQAGRGVWHWGKPSPGSFCRGYQLWIALPPELELSEAMSQHVPPDKIDTDGKVRVLLGQYGSLRSPIQVPLPITYLHVRLSDGETWKYTPQSQHNVAWLAIHTGRIRVPGATLERELAIFHEGNSPIELRAQGVAEFVIGSALKHRYPLLCGPSSVHTSPESLRQGLANIEALASRPAVLAATRE